MILKKYRFLSRGLQYVLYLQTLVPSELCEYLWMSVSMCVCLYGCMDACMQLVLISHTRTVLKFGYDIRENDGSPGSCLSLKGLHRFVDH